MFNQYTFFNNKKVFYIFKEIKKEEMDIIGFRRNRN